MNALQRTLVTAVALFHHATTQPDPGSGSASPAAAGAGVITCGPWEGLYFEGSA
ncbi:hypothetical protein [Arthrobacter sp. Bi83]|uniref:hypothetical protein n=1 Tax=Arthrobacter sp. Bi83 TaxID=2822353 RepID=UPI001E302BAF|nr:hypothetical protein [Arthrobacter sp. Bi83]